VKVAVAEGRDDEARVARWPEAAVHTVTVVLGAGVLSLPYATAQVGLALGAVLLTVACLASYYSANLLAHLADYDGDVPSEGGNGPEAGSTVDCGSSAGSKKRLATYGDIGVAAFGDTLGRWLTVPFQWMVLVGVSIIFFGLGGQSLAGVVEYVSSVILAGGASIPGETKPVLQWPWKLLFTVLCMLASPLGGIHESFWISALSGSVSIVYSAIAVAMSCIDIAVNGMAVSSGASCDDSAGPALPHDHATTALFHAFNAIGIVVFAFGGHSIMPEIQATLAPEPSTQAGNSSMTSSARPMMKGVFAAYVPTTTLYFALSITGYLAYGDCVHTNVLLSSTSEYASAIASFADLLVAVHVFGAIQLYLSPPIQLIRDTAMRWARSVTTNPSSQLRSDALWRFTVGPVFMLALGAFSAAVPDAAGPIGIVGGIGITWMTFALPSVIFVKTAYRNSAVSKSLIAFNVALAVVCTFLGVLSTVGAVYTTFYGI
jgi:amino acid permease